MNLIVEGGYLVINIILIVELYVLCLVSITDADLPKHMEIVEQISYKNDYD